MLMTRDQEKRWITAVRAGDVAAAAGLLGEGLDPNQADRFGLRLLARAVWNDRLEIVRLLLAAGADVNARNARGATPLMRARSAEAVRLLLQAGADLAARDEAGSTALIEVAAMGYDDALAA